MISPSSYQQIPSPYIFSDVLLCLWQRDVDGAALFIIKEEANFSLFQRARPHAQQLLKVNLFYLLTATDF